MESEDVRARSILFHRFDSGKASQNVSMYARTIRVRVSMQVRPR